MSLLKWHDNPSGKESTLYLGGIYIASVGRMVPEGWREWDCYKLGPPSDTPEYIKTNTEHQKRLHEKHDAKPWRGWLMTDEDGEEAGWWETLDEAKAMMLILAEVVMGSDDIGEQHD